MIIKEWDSNLIVTDNVLTNLPISQLSSIPTVADGLFPTDLILISKLCTPQNMTSTGYMSYNASLADVSSFAYSALGIEAITSNISQISGYLGRLLGFEEMLNKMTRDQLAVVDLFDEDDRFNPLVISAIHAVSGILLSDLSGYRFSDTMESIFNWKIFTKISAGSGHFTNLTATNLTSTNANITNLTVNGQPYKHLNYAIPENTYPSTTKVDNTFYFTY